MATPRIERPDDHRDKDDTVEDLVRRDQGRGGSAPDARTEPVLAAIGAAAAVTAQLLTTVGGLWLLLDVAALLAATVSVGMLLRALAVERGRPVLAEVATGVTTAGSALIVLLLARHGPEGYVGMLFLTVAATMGGALTLLVLVGAAIRSLREPMPETVVVGSGPVTGRVTMAVTLVAALIAVAAPVVDLLVR